MGKGRFKHGPCFQYCVQFLFLTSMPYNRILLSAKKVVSVNRLQLYHYHFAASHVFALVQQLPCSLQVSVAGCIR